MLARPRTFNSCIVWGFAKFPLGLCSTDGTGGFVPSGEAFVVGIVAVVSSFLDGDDLSPEGVDPLDGALENPTRSLPDSHLKHHYLEYPKHFDPLAMRHLIAEHPHHSSLAHFDQPYSLEDFQEYLGYADTFDSVKLCSADGVFTSQFL